MAVQLDEATKLYQARIDEHAYEFSKWGAEDAIETLFDLSMVLGEPLSAMLRKASEAPPDTPQPSLAQMMDPLVRGLSGSLKSNRDVTLALIKRLATRQVMCDHRPLPPFDLHYKGRLPHLFRVVAAALEVQYGGFIEAVSEATGVRLRGPDAPPRKQAEASPSPEASTGSSGGL